MGAVQCGDFTLDHFTAVKRGKLRSHVRAVHRDGDYQCDKCDFEAIINKLMFKQFVVVIPNVLTIVNKIRYERGQRGDITRLRKL